MYTKFPLSHSTQARWWFINLFINSLELHGDESLLFILFNHPSRHSPSFYSMNELINLVFPLAISQHPTRQAVPPKSLIILDCVGSHQTTKYPYHTMWRNVNEDLTDLSLLIFVCRDNVSNVSVIGYICFYSCNTTLGSAMGH